MKRERIKNIKIENLSQNFDGVNKIFSDINFTLPMGECVTIHGGPGSGKSLLLKIIAGLIEPSEGAVIYNDKKIKKLSFEEFTPMRLSTAICFENGGLLMNKTLEENLKLLLQYHNQWRSERSQGLFEKLTSGFKLKNYLHLRPAQVSMGVRKTAGLVRAILGNPQILFLDEPSLGIGEEATDILKSWINEFRNGTLKDQTVLMTTQDSKLVNGLESVSWYLNKGMIEMSGQRKKAS